MCHGTVFPSLGAITRTWHYSGALRGRSDPKHMQHRNNRSSTALVLLFILVAHGLAAQTPELHWAAQFGGTSSSLGRAVAVDAQGNVYTGGRFNGQVDMDPGPGTLPFTSAGSTDVLLTKVDAQGALLWARSWGAAGQDDAFALAVDAQGNVHLAGIFEGAVDFDPGPGLALLTAFGGSDVFVSKFDPSGELLWARQLGGNSTDRCTAIAVDPQGNVYTAGTFQSQADFDPGPASSTLRPLSRAPTLYPSSMRMGPLFGPKRWLAR